MKKFTKTYDVSDYEVLTDTDFVPIAKVMQTIPYKIYTLTLSNSLTLMCADNHILMDTAYNEVFAKDSLGATIKTVYGDAEVINIEQSPDEVPMYDLQLESYHMYYTNGILSHNTTVVAAYLLHMAIFNKDYSIAILANKKPQAEEILGRIKLMYRSLPWWLQPGVKRWNVRDILITLGDNGTSVFTESTAGSSIRGKTVNCLGGDTILQLQHRETGEIFNIDMQRLYEILDDKEKLYTDSQVV